jgi:hypothetical protein
MSYRNDEDRIEDLHHLGLIYRIAAAGGTLRTGPDGEDSAGALWVPRILLAELDVTPFARAAFESRLVPLFLF